MVLETGAQPPEQPRPQRQLPQEHSTTIRSEFPTVEPADHSLASQAPKFQALRGTLCSYKVAVQTRYKLFIIHRLYHDRRPYTLPVMRNAG